MGEHESKKRKTGPTNGTSKTITTINGDMSVSSQATTRGRQHTVSVAVPGSILAGVPTQALQTQLAGQVARALSIFSIDEVIVFEDGQPNSSSSQPSTNGRASSSSEHTNDEYTGTTNPSHFLAHILTYLETPPYLRTALFPLPHHANLRSIAIIPPLDLPHHTASTDWRPFREAVSRGPSPSSPYNSLLDVGLDEPVLVPGEIPEPSRVTLRFPAPTGSKKSRTAKGEVEVEAVGPTVPREEAGHPWGYQVRTASSLSAVITECGYDGGYDLTLGVSGSGSGFQQEPDRTPKQEPAQDFTEALHTIARTRTFYTNDESEGVRHMLIVLGNGPCGLEGAAEADEELKGLGVAEEVHRLFDFWVGLPGSAAGVAGGKAYGKAGGKAGGVVVRTEETIWMVLMGLRELVMC